MFPGQFHSPRLPAEKESKKQKEKEQLSTVAKFTLKTPTGSDLESP